MLNFKCVTAPPARGNVEIIDVSQSMHRIPSATNEMPCITPHGKFVLLCGSDFEIVESDAKFESRVILGCELLQLQGFDLGSLPAPGRRSLQSFSHADMSKLAGNAFAGPCFSAAVLTALRVFSGRFLTSGPPLTLLRKKNKSMSVRDVLDKAHKTFFEKELANAQRGRRGRSDRALSLEDAPVFA